MKRVLFFIQFLLFALLSFANPYEKEFKKIVESYDVPQEAKSGVVSCPSAYWSALLDNNDLLFKFKSEMTKMKGAQKEALKKFSEIPRFYVRYDESICDDKQGFCDTLLMDMGISPQIYKCNLHIVLDEQVNAYTVLTEDGFAMLLSTGLILKEGCTYDILKAVVAHEFTHGIYCHHLQSLYKTEKLRRQATLSKAIAMTGEAFAAGAKALAGEKYDNSEIHENMREISERINTERDLYSFEYMREQEFEADIVAYRFMQWIGKGDIYLELLRFLGSDFDFLYNGYSDHPKSTTRINLIKYIKSNPEIYNTKIAKLRKKANKSK